MRALVTGCAGFIGSSLTDRLIQNGLEVYGIDCFTDNYSATAKRKNLANAFPSPRFTLIDRDIIEMDLYPEVDYVFHLAAQAGVRDSWGRNFHRYTRNNIDATQKLLEYYKDRDIRKLIFASSSSVYGNVALPMVEDGATSPVSPYGVSKLAGERICHLYWESFGLPVISLRFFTVFGPRQRPDMLIYRLINAAMYCRRVTVYGDGEQTRDFTYIDDVVDAILLAASSDISGDVFNLGTGGRISINCLIGKVEELTGRPVAVERASVQKGDVWNSCAGIAKARQALGWKPMISMEEGLAREIAWMSGVPDDR